jgi:hypothetical protein
VTDFEAEIIDHRPGAARRVAGAEIAINIGLGEACVFDRALGDFGMELCGGFIGCVPGRMLVNPGNVGFALDGASAALASGEYSAGRETTASSSRVVARGRVSVLALPVISRMRVSSTPRLLH